VPIVKPESSFSAAKASRNQGDIRYAEFSGKGFPIW
jgi:hypothetical protein